MTKRFQFRCRFVSVQYRNTVSVFADNMRNMFKVIFKVTRSVSASGGNYRIKFCQSFYDFKRSLKRGFYFNQFVQDIWNQFLILRRQFDQCLVSCGKNAKYIVKTD